MLLKGREADRVHFEESVLYNVKELLEPYIKKLAETPLDPKQQALLGIITTHAEEVISPFGRRLSWEHLDLTRTEIQVAGLIKAGKNTRQIAAVLNISPRTVDTHRKNIRRKIGLTKKRANLRSYLLAFD